MTPGSGSTAFSAKAVPLLPASLAQKYIRLKRIKCNNARAQRDTRLQEGDVLQLYINDEFFDKPSRGQRLSDGDGSRSSTSSMRTKTSCLWTKSPAWPCIRTTARSMGARSSTIFRPISMQKDEWRPREEQAFTPALCNRIDRNTGGIVIASKTAEALRILNQKIRDRELDKRYLAVVEGTPRPETGVLKGYLFKDAVKNRVFVTDTPQKGAKTCETRYRTLTKRGGLSLVECELITGRTHQIRAQFAHAGHPLLGDGKYGKLDPHADRRYQALYSYRLTFCFTTDAGVLAPLNGRSFQVADVEFVKTYFPDFRLPGIAE